MHLLLWLLFADVSVPRHDWAARCQTQLVAAAHAYSGTDQWFDLWWKFRVEKDSVVVRYTANVDICGVYDDYRIQVRRHGARVQKLHDDGNDFAAFKKAFEPALQACSGEDDEQDGGEQGRPIAKHESADRTSRATPQPGGIVSAEDGDCNSRRGDSPHHCDVGVRNRSRRPHH